MSMWRSTVSEVYFWYQALRDVLLQNEEMR